jgi:hypothetical protein
VALQACLRAARQLEQGYDATLEQHRRQAEQARYNAARAERRYQVVDPDNRLVVRGLEAAWEKALTELAAAETELTRRQAARPATLTAAERAAILALGDDLQAVWDAPSTTDKDRKQLLRTLLDEVNITVHRDHDGGMPTWCCGGRAGRSASWPSPSSAHPRGGCAPMRAPSAWSAGWPSTTTTPRSRGSSTASTAAPPADCHTPPVGSRACGTTGASPATRTPQITRKETCAPWPTPPAS